MQDKKISYLVVIYRANLDFFTGSVLESIIQGGHSLLNAIHYLNAMKDLGWVGSASQVAELNPLLIQYRNTPTEDMIRGLINLTKADMYGKQKREEAINNLLNTVKKNLETFN